MTNNNWKLIENKKPAEIVQEIEDKKAFDKADQIDNAWEREIENEEREIFEQIEIQKRTDEEGFYVAEALNDNSSSNLANQPTNSKEETKKYFLFKIRLRNCYLANARISWLFRDGFYHYNFEKLEEAQDLLQKLEAGDTSIFSYWRGIETSHAKEVKVRLIKKLQTCINHYQNKGGVMVYFKE